MQTLDMTFFEEFKRLENICNDMFSCKSGVTEYITQMEAEANKGRIVIISWDADYKTLKHLRWLRNQIAHSADGGAVCQQEDLTQLRKFHKRVLAQEDPLAQLTKAAAKPKAVVKPKAPAQPKQTQSAAARKAASTSEASKATAKKLGEKKKKQKPEKQSHAGAVILLIIVILLFLGGLCVLYLDASGILPLSELGDTIRKLPEIIRG